MFLRKGDFFIMTIAEYVFAVIGMLIIIGGFAYGIYDSYFEKTHHKHESSANSKNGTD